MNTSRRPVVIGVSGNQPTAIRYALAESERQDTTLRVVHCYSLSVGSSDFPVGAEFLGSIEAESEQTLAHAHEVVLAEASSQNVTYVTIEGETIATLLTEGEAAESIVLGADDVSWFDRMLGGAVAGRVTRGATCPVIVVPERSDPTDERGEVVVTVDGDTSAAGPLSYGFDQAQARGVGLVVLHAVPYATAEADFDSHRSNVAEVIAGWRELYPDVRVLVTSSLGEPVDTAIAATASASLVVVGRPHGPDRSFALTRPVAMRVLRGAQCPVAVVPASYRRDRVGGSTRGGHRVALA